MTRPPRWSPAPDLSYAETIGDPYPARAATLLDIDQRQHAAITGYGGPAQVQSLQWEVTSGTSPVTRYLYIRTLGAATVALRFLVTGSGRLALTTPADATGTSLDWHRAITPEWIGTRLDTSGVSGRALGVRASADRVWDNEFATATLTSLASADASVLAVVVVPLHTDI